jgi:hypothetical protein
LKVVLLDYTRGLISSRKIEQACRENIIFMALACGQRPDHSTIAAFVSSMQDQILPNIFVSLRSRSRMFFTSTLRADMSIQLSWISKTSAGSAIAAPGRWIASQSKMVQCQMMVGWRIRNVLTESMNPNAQK